MSLIRTRWAAIGAAVAITLGAGGVSLSRAAPVNSGDKPVFVAITPCRLMDTRPATQIGPRGTPLGEGDTLTLQITGSTGDCAGVPADAVAAGMNVTAIQGSDRSFLTVYPADAALPDVSNLNWTAGAPPTPNKVDVGLSPSGAVRMTNAFGTVHIAADLVGYYIDHTHDDRYYTTNQIDALHAEQTQYLSIAPAEFQARYTGATTSALGAHGELYVVGGTEDHFYAPVHLPDGATIDALHAWVEDDSLFDSPARNLDITLYSLAYHSGYVNLFEVQSLYQPSPTKLTDDTHSGTQPHVVDNAAWMYVVSVVVIGSNWADYGSVLALHGVTVEYTTHS